MQRSKNWFVSRLAVVTVGVLVCQGAMADPLPKSVEIKNLLEFQCYAAKTLKQAEANYANMARGFTDSHPVMECLKKKIEELRAAGK